MMMNKLSENSHLRLRCSDSMTIICLAGALGGVRLAIDDLEVRHAPESEQLRPRSVPVLLPYPKQRDAMVDLRALMQALAGLSAAPFLEAFEQSDVIARRVPEFPCGYADGVPLRIPVATFTPEVDMPAEPVDRLATHAAESGAARKAALAVRHWRKPEAHRQVAVPFRREPPGPA